MPSTAYFVNLIVVLSFCLLLYYIRLGQPDQSHRILGEAFIALHTIQGAELKMLALTGIAQAYINAAQPALAAPALERALQVAQTSNNPNPYRQAGALDASPAFTRKLVHPNVPCKSSA
jgi:hypothetical protein